VLVLKLTLESESLKELLKESKQAVQSECKRLGLEFTGTKQALAELIIDTPWLRVEIDEAARMSALFDVLLRAWKYDNLHLFSLTKLPKPEVQAQRAADARARKEHLEELFRRNPGGGTAAEARELFRINLRGQHSVEEDCSDDGGDGDAPPNVWNAPAFAWEEENDDMLPRIRGKSDAPLSAANLEAGDRLKLVYDRFSSDRLEGVLTVEAIRTGVPLPISSGDCDFARLLGKSKKNPRRQYR
jgi:hypothetical protein